MIPVIVIRKHYKLEKDTYLKHGCGYALNDRSINPGGYGVSPYSLKDAYTQMLAVKKYYGKTSGNQLIHLVISYDDSVTSEDKACALSCKLAGYYRKDYQVLYCTHSKDRHCSNYHAHIVVNSVSYIDGRMFNSSIENMQLFCEYVSEVTGQKTRLYFEKPKQINSTKDTDKS